MYDNISHIRDSSIDSSSSSIKPSNLVFNEVQVVVLTLNFPAIAEAGHAEQSFNYLSQLGKNMIYFSWKAHTEYGEL
jgi:hypothetical protein